MLLIGLTGPSGSGKGAFCRILLEKYGIASIDADAVYHELLVPPSPCLDALKNAFGAEILESDGALNRKKLAALVFSPEDESVREARIGELNGITHRYVLDKTKELLGNAEKQGAKAMIFDAPALYESGADQWCDLVVAVTASHEVRLRRIMDRDGLTAEAAEMRIRGQHPEHFYTDPATAVIRNDGSREDLEHAVTEFYESCLKDRLS